MSKKLFRQERLQSILERLLAGKAVHVDDLAREFGLSSSSIRMDLAELESRGVLTRTHGGAILAERAGNGVLTQKSALELRTHARVGEKEAIGRAAAALIEDGDTLMIDGGSTTLHVARRLRGKRNLTIITNGVSLLPDLMALPDAQIYITGGYVDPKLATLLGDLTVDALSHFRTSKAIVGIDGVTLRAGLTVTNPFVAATKRKMIEASEQLIVVSDHTKLGQVCLIPLAGIAEMTWLVTDQEAPAELVEGIREAGPQVILAPVDRSRTASD